MPPCGNLVVSSPLVFNVGRKVMAKHALWVAVILAQFISYRADAQVNPKARADDPQARDGEVTFRGKIVLVGVQLKGNEGSSIATVNPDGTGLKTLYTFSEKGVAIVSGRVSPDARSVAMTVVGRGTNEDQVWLLGPKGECRKILDGGFVMAWSPDGKQLACIGGRYGKWKSFILDIATKETRPIRVPDKDHVNDWSPDGGYFAVMLGRPDKTVILRGSETYPVRQVGMLRASGDKEQATSSDIAADNLWVRFSPDGKRISHYQREYRNDLPHELSMVRDRDGGRVSVVLDYDRLDENFRLRPAGTPIWNPEAPGCWSPDGKTIAWLVSNDKLRSVPSKRGEKSKFALLFTDSTGGIERSVDLEALGLVSYPAEVDWGREAN